LAAGLACGKRSDVGEPAETTAAPAETSAAPAETTAAGPADAAAPAFTERGRIAVTRVDGEDLRQCYDVAVAIDRNHPSLQPPAEAALPEVGARQLALLLLDYVVVSADVGDGPAENATGQLAEMVKLYVTRAAPTGLPADQQASYADSARQVQAMTWPTETLASEASSGALVETSACADLAEKPRAACRVQIEQPGFVWSIQRSYFGDQTDADAAKAWCQRHGGDWLSGS
jgi:hypothetical protein